MKTTTLPLLSPSDVLVPAIIHNLRQAHRHKTPLEDEHIMKCLVMLKELKDFIPEVSAVNTSKFSSWEK